MSVNTNIEELADQLRDLSASASQAEDLAQTALGNIEVQDYAAALSNLERIPDLLRNPTWPEDLIAMAGNARSEIEENASV